MYVICNVFDLVDHRFGHLFIYLRNLSRKKYVDLDFWPDPSDNDKGHKLAASYILSHWRA